MKCQALSELPAFLVKDGGLNSGFMLAHCTAASLGIYLDFFCCFAFRELLGNYDN